MTAAPLVVVGASLAGLRAVEGARASGYDGPIVLVGSETHLPYDRPPLSKECLAAGDPPAATTLRTADELTAYDVELRLGAPATALDVAGRRLEVDGAWLPYRAVVLATGATARTLPGPRLAGVHTVRTVEDALAVRAALDAGARTVVVGGGFIGSEVASAARARDLPVSIVEVAPLPLVRAVGPQLARACADLHGRFGTDLRCGIGVRALHGDDRVTGVELDDGTVLPADLVIVGIGAAPATGWLAGSGLTLDDGIVCDATLRAADGVYAAGDVARWPNALFDDQPMRLEHWTSANEQGAAAARNALDPAAAAAFTTVPYFWSDWYGQRFQMVGVAEADEVHVVGELDGESWLALYRRGERLVGAFAFNLPGKIMKFRKRLAARGLFAEALAFAEGGVQAPG